MKAGDRLTADTEAKGSGGAVLRYQGDGAIVLYVAGQPRWSSGKFAAPGHLELQPDGNAVAYDATGAPYWATDTHAPGAELVIDRSGLKIVSTVVTTIWQTPPLPDEPPPPPPPSPVTLTRLRVEDNKRYFANDAGRFDWREMSAFSLLGRVLKGEDAYVRDWLVKRRAEGFTITRVFLTLDGDYWKHYRSAPDMPGYWGALDRLAALHAEAGLYMRACFLGALEPFGGVWYQDRRDVYEGSVRTKAEQFVVEAAQRLGAHPHIVGELSNEPTQIGMRHAWDNGALVSLGQKVKAVAPSMLLCGGEDNDGKGVVAPFDYADAHLDREHEIAGWQWLKRRLSEHPVIDQRIMPFVAGENRNMGEDRADGNTGDGPEKQPSVCFGVAALSRARRVAGVCFHWDGGLWTTEPKNETPACIAAWHKGFDAFPMLTDPMWRGQWGLARGDYWKDVWPGSDDPATVERHVKDGTGPWRACGCGSYSVCFPEPKNWNWKANLDAPAERVGYNDEGVFSVGVYKRL